MSIRPATAADLASIMELEQQCFTAAHWTEQQYAQLLQHSGGVERIALVAVGPHPVAMHLGPASEEGSTVLGFLVAKHLPPEWELENIVVAPSARRTGLGRLLLQALLSKARETNSDAVFLEVRESNIAARTLYEQAGFEQIARRKSYYTNPQEDALIYRWQAGKS